MTEDGDFRIKVLALGASSATEYAISASSNLDELVANINREAGAQVQASINEDGKLVLSNNTGATISVNDTTEATGYETGSGFSGQAAATDFDDYSGFLKLESDDGNPIRIERGNRGLTTPGSVDDVAELGFREVTSQVSNSLDAYTVTGSALTAGGVAAEWGERDLKINGVAIYDKDIVTDTFQSKLDAINNFSEETGVIAYAYLDKTISFAASAFVSGGGPTGYSVGTTIAFNGQTVYTAAAGATIADVATAINSHTASTGITAVVDGLNMRLTGSNVTSLKIDTAAPGGTAGNAMGLADDSIYYASIRLDSAGNKPISIELGEDADVNEHGFLEQNIGAADFEVNAATLGVGNGRTIDGLNISTANSATNAITTIDNAIEKVSEMRSKLGAMENRLVATVNNLSNIVTNTQASRSRIQDTDYASETTALAKAQIISQAATAMLAQANQQPQSVLSLLK